MSCQVTVTGKTAEGESVTFSVIRDDCEAAIHEAVRRAWEQKLLQVSYSTNPDHQDPDEILPMQEGGVVDWRNPEDMHPEPAEGTYQVVKGNEVRSAPNILEAQWLAREMSQEYSGTVHIWEDRGERWHPLGVYKDGKPLREMQEGGVVGDDIGEGRNLIHPSDVKPHIHAISTPGGNVTIADEHRAWIAAHDAPCVFCDMTNAEVEAEMSLSGMQEGAAVVEDTPEGVPAIIGEAGPEAVIPLDDPEAVEVMAEAIEEGGADSEAVAMEAAGDAVEAAAEAVETIAVAEAAADIAEAEADAAVEIAEAEAEAVEDTAEAIEEVAEVEAEAVEEVAESEAEAVEEVAEAAEEIAEDEAPEVSNWFFRKARRKAGASRFWG